MWKKQSRMQLKLLKKNENIKGIYGCNNTLQLGLQRHLQNKNERILLWLDLIWQRRQNSLLKTRIIEGFLNAKTRPDGISGNRDFEFPYQWKKSEQKYFDTGVIMIDSDYLMEKGVS